jgi:NitT/TauT family transport system substrate-binding protein
MSLRRPSLLAAAGALTLATTPLLADPVKLKIACTATSDCASAMVARDQGIFAKHGLDADVTLIGINTNIPPAIASDSIQIGGPTSPVFLQAVDGGLDLVAVAGASVMDPEESKTIAAVARTGVSIKEPKDFVGKKVGAPGIGAFLHVLFRKWLIEKEPILSRITKAGNGEVAALYAADLARHDPIIFYAASRKFAEGHPDIIKAFRAAIDEAAPIVNSDREAATQSIAKFTKMPIDLVRQTRPDVAKPELKGSDLAWWVETMKQQDMLQGSLDLNKLVLP